MEYVERFAAYELSYAPGDERAAYAALLAALPARTEHERLPTLLSAPEISRKANSIFHWISAFPTRRRNFLAMRFAVISDIHGNLEALQAVLADARGASLHALRLPRRHRRLQRQPE